MSYPLRVLLLTLLITIASAAETMKVGDTLPVFSAKDQFGKDFELKPGPDYLMVSFDMSTGKKANTFFAAKDATFLDKLKAVYVSNIHGMPAVGRMFALPKMRRYPHRIILADSDNLLRDYPSQKDHITVLGLDPHLKITSISYWDPGKELPAELNK